ncbi:MAG: YifB family Mg chelatase-like AAA ATPase [Candidatus Wildermuthbacteria bacterium]|nr:YifB family Mg chelatase-like AAA ATPase [Candidatus Wildermuthbacteria bacterium]
MLIKVPSASHFGLDSIGVEVEINLANRGLPGFDIVGLPDKAVDESKERVRTAIINSGVEFPQKKITVNLAPADIPKEGSFYDLPIAVGILAAILQFEIPSRSLFFGEVSLDGSLRHTKGALLFALFARKAGFEHLFLPLPSANEAAIIRGIHVHPVENLQEIVVHLKGENEISPIEYQDDFSEIIPQAEFNMEEILGQEKAKRAVEIAAAGGHNILLMGSPGAGKTMLARAIPGILPLLSEEESLEVTKICSAAGIIPPGGSLVRLRPFRAPHHTISQIGLTGGGSRPQPGEITLSHRGVLFLDEFNEFPRSVLESLRQPLEDGEVTISRSRERVTYPSRFMLVASANPCPCGYLNHSKKPCICSPREIERYRKRVSGPILDRIDIHIEVPDVDIRDLAQDSRAAKFVEASDVIKDRVMKARHLQEKRFHSDRIHTNAEMKNVHIKKHCSLPLEAQQMLAKAAAAFHVSARSYFKLIKIARTIADLEGASSIGVPHLAEALQYRSRVYDAV